MEGKEEYAIVDGNLDPHPTESLVASDQGTSGGTAGGDGDAGAADRGRGGKLSRNSLALSAACRSFGEDILPRTTRQLRSMLVTWIMQFAARESRRFWNCSKRSAGIATSRAFPASPKRLLTGLRATILSVRCEVLDDFPWYPYHRIPAERYLLPTFLGRRTAVHQASIGCPYRCNFCGVVNFSGSREKMESPARTEGILRHLAETYGVDAVQFYDNNFFLREDHTRELADRMAPLNLRWWCEGRTDIMMKYSDATFEAIRRAGCTMIFFGAESGSNEILKEMNKDLAPRTRWRWLRASGALASFPNSPSSSEIRKIPRATPATASGSSAS